MSTRRHGDGGVRGLRLERTDIHETSSPLDDRIRWVWRLVDPNLPDGFTWIHCATPRNGRPITDIRHSTIDGVYWLDPVAEFDGVGLPLDDPELLSLLHEAIEDELRRVDLNRLLLIHSPPSPPRRLSAMARRAA